MGKKKPPYTLNRGALQWNNDVPFVQNVNEIKEPQASAIAEKLQYSSDKRQLLCSYFLNGGNTSGQGFFRGKVVGFKRIHRNGGLSILLKPLFVTFVGYDGKPVEGMESHVWIQDNGAFQFMHVKQGNCYSFNANAYLYDRGNGNYDFSLKDCNNLRLISEKELPDPVTLKKENFAALACNYCILQENCSKNTCQMPEWRKQMASGLAHPVNVSTKKATHKVEKKHDISHILQQETGNSQQVVDNVSAKNWIVKVYETKSLFEKTHTILSETSIQSKIEHSFLI